MLNYSFLQYIAAKTEHSLIEMRSMAVNMNRETHTIYTWIYCYEHDIEQYRWRLIDLVMQVLSYCCIHKDNAPHTLTWYISSTGMYTTRDRDTAYDSPNSTFLWTSP